jgi:hypothetical protein
MLFSYGAAFAAAHPVTYARGEVHRVIAAAPGSVTLYDQNNEDSGVGVVSTDFTGDFDSFDSYGADDFTVPVGHKWTVRQVEVTGSYHQGDGPAESENVRFYKDNEGLPGELVAACDIIEGKDNHGSFAITLPRPCKVHLKGGKTYWVSVSINMDFLLGDWLWETGNGLKGNPAAWENPNGGFGSCRTWGVMTSCIGNYDEGPDFMFALKGKDSVVD